MPDRTGLIRGCTLLEAWDRGQRFLANPFPSFVIHKRVFWKEPGRLSNTQTPYQKEHFRPKANTLAGCFGSRGDGGPLLLYTWEDGRAGGFHLPCC